MPPVHSRTPPLNLGTSRSKDKPEDVGFPPVEPVDAKPGAAKKKPDVIKQLVNTVLKNPFIWGMVRFYGLGSPPFQMRAWFICPLLACLLQDRPPHYLLPCLLLWPVVPACPSLHTSSFSALPPPPRSPPPPQKKLQALTYFFIYIVRQGVTSWFVFYLIKEKGVADAADVRCHDPA